MNKRLEENESQKAKNNLLKIHEIYRNLYGDTPEWNNLVGKMNRYERERPIHLREMDIHHANWYTQEDVIGMTLYVDLFSGNFEGMKKKIPYLKELGISFVHFMPLLESREGQNDGGYAVKNYKATNPELGDMDTFSELVHCLYDAGIRTCVDFVVNHTAKEHEWAMKAAEGEVAYQNMYYMFDTDEIPKAYDRTVPEVFPGVSPGNFTYYKHFNKWVYTSFYEFQWDLNFKNPVVFNEIIDILLFLANQGINAIRLDAIPFMWKTLGTNCRNLPEIHELLKMMQLITQVVCKSVALLGEAIVEPEEIIRYFGEEEKECNLMYNANLMVNIWNAIATRDARLLKIDQDRFKLSNHGIWINYIRCHDDIGWGFNEQAIQGMGMSPQEHKQFLIQFYKGDFSQSFSKGELYEFNPTTMDARNSGTLASLCGLERAMEEKDAYQIELAYKRIHLIYGLIFAAPGIPLIYSGDEIAALNDYSYKGDPDKQHDSRWLHRRSFDWNQANKQVNQESKEGITFNFIKEMIRIRKNNAIFNSLIPMRTIELNNLHLFSFVKEVDGQAFVGVFNFSEDRQFIYTEGFKKAGIGGQKRDLIQGRLVDFEESRLQIGPYQFLWLL